MRVKNFGIVALALLAAGCSKENKITLETARVERGDISRSVTATGTVESVTQVDGRHSGDRYNRQTLCGL